MAKSKKSKKSRGKKSSKKSSKSSKSASKKESEEEALLKLKLSELKAEGELPEDMKKLGDRVRKRLKEIDFDELKEEIQERPLLYTALTLSLGVAIGSLLTRRR